MKNSRTLPLVAILLFVVLPSYTGNGQDTLLFDNSSLDLRYRFSPGEYEVGDQIRLQSGGFLKRFAFEFYGTNSMSPENASFAGAVEARVRFYRQDGELFNGMVSPGSVLYDSDWFTVSQPTPRNTFVFEAESEFPAEGLFLGETELTWSVQFRGMAATDEVGLDIYSPPTVGQSWPDYWRFIPESGWRLETSDVPVDFAARFQGTIPEPSGVTLILFGGMALVLANRSRGRQVKR